MNDKDRMILSDNIEEALKQLALNKNVKTMIYQIKDIENNDFYFDMDKAVVNIIDDDYFLIKQKLINNATIIKNIKEYLENEKVKSHTSYMIQKFLKEEL